MKFQFVSGVDHLERLVTLEGSIACVEGQNICVVDLISLIVHGELNQIIVASHRMFTPVD